MKGDIVKIKFLDHVSIQDRLITEAKDIKPSIHIVYGELLEETDEYYKVISFYSDDYFDTEQTLKFASKPSSYVWVILKSTIIEIKKLHENE